MILKGLQKMTLLDYPGKVAATVFTGGCNMRCPFCHNAPLVLFSNEVETVCTEDFFTFLKKRQGILDGVCVTGGEPLLQADLADFLGEIKSLGFSVKLDTNGTNPQKLRELIDARLVDYVAMDIKNSPSRYAETVGIDGFDLSPVFDSVSLLLSGIVDYEFRTTVVRELHSEEDLLAIAAWIKNAQHYYLQGYIDSGHLISDGLSGYSAQDLGKLLLSVQKILPVTELRGI
ncbi:MAG: anaerobic ribonucleoside-triphosphate reductase activating protein [Clostridia bacterium]|nr:anaerobic ribonucleoside-triphosphate reductase activating protein [Clostridia bacterium]